MAYTSLPEGLIWPIKSSMFGNNTVTLDATAEKIAYMGRMFWQGRAASKTIDTSGSSKIWLPTAASVFDDAGSVMDIGIQDINTSGPPLQPDGTFDAASTVTTAANTSPALTTGSTMVAATPTTGTKTIAQGDLIGIVADFTTRAGADSVAFPALGGGFSGPIVNAFLSAAWGASGTNDTGAPILVASDGTLGWLAGQTAAGVSTTTAYQLSTNPDERGLIFQVPFPCKVDALCTQLTISTADSDFTIGLFSSPESAPVTLASVTVDAAQHSALATNTRFSVFALASEIELAANTDYLVAIRATGTANVSLQAMTLGDAAHRALLNGGATLRTVTRDGGSGDFGSSSPTLISLCGVRISAIDFGGAADPVFFSHQSLVHHSRVVRY